MERQLSLQLDTVFANITLELKKNFLPQNRVVPININLVLRFDMFGWKYCFDLKGRKKASSGLIDKHVLVGKISKSGEGCLLNRFGTRLQTSRKVMYIDPPRTLCYEECAELDI